MAWSALARALEHAASQESLGGTPRPLGCSHPPCRPRPMPFFEQRMPISTDAPRLSGLLVGSTRWWRISFPGVRKQFFEFRSGLFLGSVVTGLFCRFQLFLRFHFWALALGHGTSSTAFRESLPSKLPPAQWVGQFGSPGLALISDESEAKGRSTVSERERSVVSGVSEIRADPSPCQQTRPPPARLGVLDILGEFSL